MVSPLKRLLTTKILSYYTKFCTTGSWKMVENMRGIDDNRSRLLSLSSVFSSTIGQKLLYLTYSICLLKTKILMHNDAILQKIHFRHSLWFLVSSSSRVMIGMGRIFIEVPFYKIFLKYFYLNCKWKSNCSRWKLVLWNSSLFRCSFWCHKDLCKKVLVWTRAWF